MPKPAQTPERGSPGPGKSTVTIKGAREMRKSSTENARDSFSLLVRKNVSPKGKCFGPELLTDAQGINLLDPEKTYPEVP